MIPDYKRPHMHTHRGSENSALLRGERKIGVRAKITAGILKSHTKINQSLRKKLRHQNSQDSILKLML